jgi:hypothetical protein
MSRKRIAIGVPYLILTWVFGGWYGVLAGIAILALWVSLGPFGRALWAVAIVLLLAAPIATMAQGLPSGTFVGGLEAEHLVAHVLVALALATAGLAAIAELGNERRVFGRSGSGSASGAASKSGGHQSEASMEAESGAPER